MFFVWYSPAKCAASKLLVCFWWLLLISVPHIVIKLIFVEQAILVFVETQKVEDEEASFVWPCDGGLGCGGCLGHQPQPRTWDPADDSCESFFLQIIHQPVFILCYISYDSLCWLFFKWIRYKVSGYKMALKKNWEPNLSLFSLGTLRDKFQKICLG